MERRPWILVLSVFALTASACVSTGEVREISKPPSLTTFAKPIVAVAAADPGMTNAAAQVRTCQAEIPAALLEENVFGQVMSDPELADLLIDVKIVESGSAFKVGGLVREDKVVHLEIRLVDQKTKQPIGELAVSGNSKSNVDHGIGGVSVANFDDQMKKACRAAGEHLATYLADNRKS